MFGEDAEGGFRGFHEMYELKYNTYCIRQELFSALRMNGTNEHTPLGVGRKWLPFGGNRGPATAGSEMAVMMKALVPAFPFEVKQVSQKKNCPY